MTRRVRDALPKTTFKLLSKAFENGMGPVDNHRLEDLILGILRRSKSTEIASWLDVGEGLENRIKDQAQRAAGLDELLALVKTRRSREKR
jgi:predicted nucleotidyltransferase